MNPQNGELYAMVNVPEFNLNEPFAIGENMEEWNKVWRNGCVSDTYEPGSIFKIITAAAALEQIPDIESRKFWCEGSCQIHG